MEHNFRLTQMLKGAYRKSRHGVASLADLKIVSQHRNSDPQDAGLITTI